MITCVPTRQHRVVSSQVFRPAAILIGIVSDVIKRAALLSLYRCCEGTCWVRLDFSTN